MCGDGIYSEDLKTLNMVRFSC